MAETVQYLSTKGFAERVGLNAGYTRQLRMEGKLPAPDVVVADQPGWLPETVDRWKEARSTS